MKYTILIFLFSLITSVGLVGQSRTIITEDGKVETTLKAESYSKIASADKTYFYVKANELYLTQGAFEGQLLHGITSFYDDKGNLVSKGKFVNGLKQGKWMHWNSEGRLIEIISWKKGVKHGYYKELETEETYVEGEWRLDKKHGTWSTFEDGTLKQVEFYKNGELTEPKVKKEKKKRFKIQLFKEKKDGEDDVDKEESEKQENKKNEEQKS